MVNKRVQGLARRDIGSGSSFKYVPAKPEYVKQQTERRGGGQYDSIFKGNYLQYRMTDGDNKFRILPATWTPHDDFAYIVWAHKWINQRGNFLCLNKMSEGEKFCPICEEWQRALRDKDEERAQQLAPSELMCCWLLDRRSRELQDRPQLYAMPPTLYKDICGVIYDADTGKAALLDDPEKGWDVRVKKTGKSLGTRYLPMLANASSPISPDPEVTEEILDEIAKNPVPKTLEYKSTKYLENILAGGAGGMRDEDEDEGRRRKGRARFDDDEPEQDEDEEDAPEDEDEEEEERPRTKVKAKSRRDEEEDEEERPRARTKSSKSRRDYDEDEEEDEERPKTKAKSRRDEDEDEEEEERPRSKSKTKSRRDEDEDEEEERPRPKRRARDEDEDENGDEDEPEDEDEEEEEEPAAAKRKSKRRQLATADDDEEEEEDNEPRPRRARSRSRRD